MLTSSVGVFLWVLERFSADQSLLMMSWQFHTFGEILEHYMKKADLLEQEVVKLKHDKAVLKNMLRSRQDSVKRQRSMHLEQN